METWLAQEASWTVWATLTMKVTYQTNVAPPKYHVSIQSRLNTLA